MDLTVQHLLAENQELMHRVEIQTHSNQQTIKSANLD